MMPDEVAPPPSKVRGRRIHTVLMVLLPVSVVLTLAGVVGLAALPKLIERRINEFHEKYRAEGQPATLEDMNAWYPAVPEDQNAAVLYMEAFKLMEEVFPGLEQLSDTYAETKSMQHIADYEPEQIAKLKEFATKAEPVTAVLSKANQFHSAHFPLDFSVGMAVELPHLAKLRSVARLLHVTAEVELIEGNYRGAVDRHAWMLSAGQALTSEPLIISQLIRVAINGIALDSLGRLLTHTQFDDDSLARLDAAYADAYRPECFRRAFIGERCMCTRTLTGVLIGSHDWDDLGTGVDLPTGPLMGGYLRYEIYSLHKAFAEAMPEAEPKWPEVVREVKKNQQEKVHGSIFTGLLMPALERAGVAFARDAANIRVARAAIAVERYRLREGEIPETLADCVPQYIESVPLDPMDGEELRYKRLPQGYVIYSLGDDQDDDDGVDFHKNDNGETDGDAAIRVLR